VCGAPVEVGAESWPVASECVIVRDAAPGTRDRACFRDLKLAGGKRALIAVAEASHVAKREAFC
jgi:hypothetical protein